MSLGLGGGNGDLKGSVEPNVKLVVGCNTSGTRAAGNIVGRSAGIFVDDKKRSQINCVAVFICRLS